MDDNGSTSGTRPRTTTIYKTELAYWRSQPRKNDPTKQNTYRFARWRALDYERKFTNREYTDEWAEKVILDQQDTGASPEQLVIFNDMVEKAMIQLSTTRKLKFLFLTIRSEGLETCLNGYLRAISEELCGDADPHSLVEIARAAGLAVRSNHFCRTANLYRKELQSIMTGLGFAV